MLSRRLVVVCVAGGYVSARQCLWGFPEYEEGIRSKGKSGKGAKGGKGKGYANTSGGGSSWDTGASGSTWKSW